MPAARTPPPPAADAVTPDVPAPPIPVAPAVSASPPSRPDGSQGGRVASAEGHLKAAIGALGPAPAPPVPGPKPAKKARPAPPAPPGLAAREESIDLLREELLDVYVRLATLQAELDVTRPGE